MLVITADSFKIQDGRGSSILGGKPGFLEGVKPLAERVSGNGDAGFLLGACQVLCGGSERVFRATSTLKKVDHHLKVTKA